MPIQPLRLRNLLIEIGMTMRTNDTEAVKTKRHWSLCPFVSLFCLFLLCFGCNNGTLYYQFKSIDEHGWLKSDTIDFEVPTSDSIHHYQLEVGVRHSTKYIYQQLKLRLSVLTPDSLSLPEQVVTIGVTDENGKRLSVGKGGLFQAQANPVSLPVAKAGIWHFKLVHQMNDSILKGVHDVGVRLMEKD